MKKNDLINREDAINSVRWGDTYPQVIDRIKALPSADTDMSEYSDRLWKTAYERGKAEAEPRTGKWIDRSEGGRIRYPWWESCECNKCGETASGAYNFCPNCGADMRGSEVEE